MFRGIIIIITLIFSLNAQAIDTWMGQQKALVLNVEWVDAETEVTREELYETFFGEDNYSLRDYFWESSNGQYDFSGDVLDWRSSDKKWSSANGCDVRFIASEGWELFKDDVEIDDYDADGNGKIDNLFIIHSGRIGSDRVGPSCMFTNLQVADETIIFQSQGLGSVGSAIPIGFYIHEAGHDHFGLPDLYGDHYHGKYGIGMWGMMGLGAWGVDNMIEDDDLFRYPSHFSPLAKIIIGWAEAEEITQTTKAVTLFPVETSNQIYGISAGRQNYYLEYRSPDGFSEDQKGHGLLIWHNYKIIQADMRDDINNGNDLGRRPLPPISENFGDDSDPFPGSEQVTVFEDSDNGIRIENIVETFGWIEFDVIIDQNFKGSRFQENVKSSRKWDGKERL